MGMTETESDALQRIMDRTEVKFAGYKTPCFLCNKGWNDGKGYAKISIRGRVWMVHRFAYELFTGDTLKGKQQVDHMCENKECWHPQHLQKCSNLINSRLRTKRHMKRKKNQ